MTDRTPAEVEACRRASSLPDDWGWETAGSAMRWTPDVEADGEVAWQFQQEGLTG